MAKASYPQIQDGEGFEVASGEIMRLACCDCGLIHDVAFAIEKNGKIGVALRRNNRSTAQRRRHLGDESKALVKGRD
jgi:uncharacterized Zn finger protein